MKEKVLLLILILVLASCNAPREVVYVQNAGDEISLSSSRLDGLSTPVIKNGDLLMISVSTISPEASAPFNSAVATPTATGTTTSSQAANTYSVNNRGEILFPVLGAVRLAGMTKAEAESYLRDKIYPRYVKEVPVVSVRFASFRVSVIGEVGHPGIITAQGDRLSIFEALAEAGDLTLYGRRENVLLIREDVQGKRLAYRINLTNKNLIDSPYYYLQQNDVLYVQPNNQKARGAAIGTGESMLIGGVSVLVSITSLLITLLR